MKVFFAQKDRELTSNRVKKYKSYLDFIDFTILFVKLLLPCSLYLVQLSRCDLFCNFANRYSYESEKRNLNKLPIPTFMGSSPSVFYFLKGS